MDDLGECCTAVLRLKGCNYMLGYLEGIFLGKGWCAQTEEISSLLIFGYHSGAQLALFVHKGHVRGCSMKEI